MTVATQDITITPEPITIHAPKRGRRAAMSEFEARELTETIKHVSVQLWILVSEAHDRKAWEALGYETWKDYVTTELQMSESRSFQILDQARVMREVARAGADVNALEPPPARVVARVKDDLPAIRRATLKALKDGMSISESLRELAKTTGAVRTTTEVETPQRRSPVMVACPACDGVGEVRRKRGDAIAKAIEDL